MTENIKTSGDAETHHWSARALNKQQLQRLALFVRALCKLGRAEKFEPIWFIEYFIPTVLDSAFDYEVIDLKDWKYGRNRHALYDPAHKRMMIRSDVYAGAIAGNGRDIFTLCHEIMHFVIFSIYGIPLFRTMNDGSFDTSKQKLLTIQDSEWQANTGAGFLLCTDEMIKKANNVFDLMGMSGMSVTAARLNIEKRAEKLNKKLWLSILVEP